MSRFSKPCIPNPYCHSRCETSHKSRRLLGGPSAKVLEDKPKTFSTIGPAPLGIEPNTSNIASPRTLELKAEIIGWNPISGGAPAKAIDHGQGSSATVPNTMPTPCYAGDSACGAADGGWYPRGLGNRGVRFVGLGILVCRERWIRRRLAFCRSFLARVTSGM